MAMVSAAVVLAEAGSGISGRSATAMVSAAVALVEAFASVVEAAVVGTVAVQVCFLCCCCRMFFMVEIQQRR
jgi:hypothetical protein